MAWSALRLTLRRTLVYAHRWLGIALGGLFVTWFASGIVMMYARMPRLTETERIARLPALDFGAATVGPGAAAHAVGEPIAAVHLAMLGNRPVYRVLSARGWHSVYADSGALVPLTTAPQAMAIVRQFAPEQPAARYDGYLDTPDQWTLELSRSLPMHRVALGDAADARLYVEAASGEVVLKTTAAERRWAYPGAILHWIYMTPIRRHGAAWAQFIIWTALIGSITAASGLVWGVWRYSRAGAYRIKHERRRSPYAGWMRWHHYAGLVAGLTTLTWVFSGLLSMDPWDWHPSTSPTTVQREALSGGPLRLDTLSASDVRDGVRALSHPKVADIVQFQGAPFLTSGVAVVGLHQDVGIRRYFPREDLLRAAALTGAAVRDAEWLDRYDSYYYDREGELPLPILRVRYDDHPGTWLYINPARGTIARKEERLTRVNRWIYHGLHSFDFPFLYYRRPLWDVIVIALSAGGLLLASSTIVPALRRFRRHARRLGTSSGETGTAE